MWDSSIVPKPNRSPMLMKRSMREIPVTISAFNMGILVIPMTTVRERFFRFIMAIQAMVPTTVATRDAISAIAKVLNNACRISLFLNKAMYHFRVKPPHFALVLLALKDSTIRVAIGAYKNTKMRKT